ncbi:MAG: amylo-alpha-1,6-glucosidase, partial [Candidatus Izemoplasmatales bacterium]|nr:amylo-alpha-1,6-glucosidase [Candidatus Izemoplasmatales bacterium]
QTKLARQVHHSFLKRFVRANGWLRDVVDQNDDAIRPNQIYALTLSFPILRGMKAKRMLRKFEHELVDLYGVRTLSLHDSRFIPKYEGDIVSRDHAYHMGTSWGFLMGTFLVAVLKTCSKPKAEKKVIHHLERIRATYDEGCIDGYAEVFDGKDGLISKGCYNQAWSVAEILRVYAMLGRGASR